MDMMTNKGRGQLLQVEVGGIVVNAVLFAARIYLLAFEQAE